jgi:hypothetical protein
MSFGVVTRRPTSDNYKSNIAYSTGATAWNLVDEVTEDEADYFYAGGTTAGVISFGIPAITHVGRPVFVKIHIKAKTTTGTGNLYASVSFSNGAAPITFGDISGLTTTNTEFIFTLRNKPSATENIVKLTWSDIDSMYPAVYFISNSSGATRCSQVWVEVGYVSDAADYVTIRPTGDNYNSNFTLVPSGGSAYQKVDEETLDTSDYLDGSVTPSAEVRFTVPSQTIRGPIQYVEICSTILGSTYGCYCTFPINGTDGATREKTAYTLGISSFDMTFECDPSTGLAWTWEQLSSLIVGFLGDTLNSATLRVYQFYLKVYYLPPFTSAVSIMPAGIGYVAGSCILDAASLAVTALRFQVDTDAAFGSPDADTGDLTESYSAGSTITKVAIFSTVAEGKLWGRIGFKASGDSDYTWYTSSVTVYFPTIGALTISNTNEQHRFSLLVTDAYNEPPLVTLAIDGHVGTMNVVSKSGSVFTYEMTALLECGEHLYDVQVDNIWKVVTLLNIPFAANYTVSETLCRLYVGERLLHAWDITIQEGFLPTMSSIDCECETYEPSGIDARLFVGRSIKLYSFTPMSITKTQNGTWKWSGKDSSYNALTEVTTELVTGQLSAELVEKVAMPILCKNPEDMTESITEMAWENVPRQDVLRQLLLCNGKYGAIRNNTLTVYPIDVSGITPILGVGKVEPDVQYTEDPRTWSWLRVWYTLKQKPNPADSLTNGSAALWTGTAADVRETNNGFLSESGAYRILKATGTVSASLAITLLSAYDRLRLKWCPNTATTLTIKLIQDGSNYFSRTITYAGSTGDGFIVTGGVTHDDILSYNVSYGKNVVGVSGRTTAPCRVRVLLKDNAGTTYADSGWISTGTDNWWGYSWGESIYKVNIATTVELQFTSLYVISASYGAQVAELRFVNWGVVGSYVGKGGYAVSRASYDKYVQKSGYSVAGNWTTYTVNEVLGAAPTGGDSTNVYGNNIQSFGYAMVNGQLVSTNNLGNGLTVQNVGGTMVVTGTVTVWSGNPILAPNGAIVGYSGSKVTASASSIKSAPTVTYIYGIQEERDWKGGTINGWQSLDLSLASFVKTGDPISLASIELAATGDNYYDTFCLYATNPQKYYVDVKSGEGKHFKEFITEGIGSEAAARLFAIGMLKILSATRSTYTVERPLSLPVNIGDVVDCDGTPLPVYQVSYDMKEGRVVFNCGQQLDDLSELLKTTGRKIEALERNIL